MKKKRIGNIICTVFIMAVLAGCGANDKVSAPASATPTTTSEAPNAETPSAQLEAETNQEEDQKTPFEDENGFTHVSSVEELVEAIRPQAKIMIEPGLYNLTDFLSEFPNVRDWDAWNNKHKYVQIQDTFDGLELVIQNVTELTIEGNSDDPADTELVIEPRYAAVLNFSECTGIELGCLTMGHTDAGDCSGDVLYFDNTKSVYLRSLDLYGCGVYGIGCDDFCGNMYVSNSIIRDCEYGPFDIYDGEGDFEFTACTFSGNGGGGFFEINEVSQLSFIACSFGQEESNYWYFDESVNFEDCEFMDPDYYPDIFDEYVPIFDPETMYEISFEEYPLESTWWNGYAVVDPQSGDTKYFSQATADDYAVLIIDSDGSAELTYRGEIENFSWYYVDRDSVCIENEEHNLYLSLYKNADSDFWLLMQYDSDLIWFY